MLNSEIMERQYLKKIDSKHTPPYLLEVQKNAYEWFFREGLRELFDEINPIKDIIGRDFELFFLDYSLDEPKFDENTARLKNLTFESSLKVRCKLVNKKTGEIKEQDVYLGDFPLMTDHGTFIINGIERVVVSQLVRSAGVFFTTDIVRGRKYYGAKIIPNRGAWLEISTDQHNVLWVKIDRKRKVAVTSLLQAFGMNTAEIKDTFKDVDNDPDINYIDATLKKDLSRTQEDALIEVYKRIRPGDLATSDNAKSLIFATFFNFERYDFSRVGRYKINKKFDFKFPNTPEHRVLKMEDLVAIISEIIKLNISQTEADDIDHLSNRRIRAVGELLQTKLRVGLARMKRIIKDKMSTLNVESIAPVQLINSRPITSVIREFFMSSQLSQFMDQVNPLAELEHKRRLSVMGPGGLQRERAGFEVRDVHRTHYGKICPIESPEGATIGLVGHMALYARVNEYGFLETPYIKVYKNLEPTSELLVGKILNEDVKGIGKVGDKVTKEMFKKLSSLKVKKIKIKPYVSDEVDYLTSSEEEKYIISINYNLVDNTYFKKNFVEARINGEAGNANIEDIDYMDISTNQIVGVSASLIPFLEHTDAHRALMGSNMQRQAVPCIKPESPVVGTGLEGNVARDSGQVYLAPVDADVMEADACHVKLLGKDKKVYSYSIRKFARSNQGTCINQRLLVKTGDKVKKGDVLVDGTSVSNGELALGQNLTVAFMCWEGGNYEDAILLSERVVEEDRYTSIHIDTKVIDIRETKIGPEVITRDIPNISEEKLKNLDEEGVIRLGAEVGPGDILVGKITPKGETELSAEERLLRAIFGDKAKDVRDSSLRLEHGERGKIVDIKTFSREKGDKLQSGVIKSIEVSIATLRKVQVGDKMAGRYGNKGVISRIVKIEDMPYLEDGTPVDILLNPLGVVSRMNLGQIFEVHLGLAAKALGMKIATPVFNGVEKDEVAAYLKKAGYPEDGKIQLYDGRTGEEFKEKTTVGVMYMLKLNHLVEDKIHQRSIGPYSLVTQQPLGGRAQFGGQRLGEMEVWALEAYGASHILQEMLTIKSDDVIGRSKAYESIIRGEPIQKLDVPESFNVLVREMKGLCLDVQLLKKDENKNFQDVSELFFDEAKLTDIANRKVLNFDGIKLSVASPEIIKGWSSGEVTKPETINYRTQKPERDGLLCEKIFGPVKDWECACGKYRKIRYKGIVCDKCGVEVTKSIVRRSKFGHIDLCVPVSHIWFLKGIPSKVGLLLDLTGQTLEKVVYFADFIITSVNEELKSEIVERLNNEYKGRKKSIDNEMKQKLSQVKSIAEKTGKKVEDVTIEIEKELENQLDSLKQEFEDTKTELSDLKVKKVLNEEKYRRLSIKFGYLFEANIGAEAIRKLLENIDLEKLYKELEEQLPTVSQLNKKRLLNRIQLVDNLTRNKIRPEWMVLTTIPVLPPNLRPIVQLDGGRFASSDLNDLYRRIINRNNRLKRLIAINAPEVICRNEKRMLQEAVDALIDNGARKSKMATASTGQRRALKSIADSLKGKQGRFRQNLLGKRVDYSGRSVIVVGPKLKIYQCGLPKIMALELFKPFVISQLIRREYVYNIRAASKLIEQGTKEVWDILEEVALNSYVLLNRAPTLHRLGMQAFKPVLIDGKAIQLHPLVCEAFNADFDGDQMAVYVPLSEEALYEASEIMLSKNNLLKPANGEPVNVPRMDMVLGAYYLTNLKDKEGYEKSDSRIFMSYDELISAYNMKVLNLQDKVSFVDEDGKVVTTIVGRALLNRVIPMGIRNYEIAFDKKAIHKIVSTSLSKYGFEKTAELLDSFKDLTFSYVTASGISLGLGDLPDITEQKKEHIEKARHEVDKIKDQYEMGFLTDQERHRKVVELWSKVKDEVSAIGEKNFDKLSPFYIMVKSGARGSSAQLNQMVSMKGTVISPSGGIIELPIRHSLQEGFDSLEYFISTHGARKGLTDTALKTSSAGYLTRRLVDVAQDVIITKDDCGDSDGVLITKEECKEIGEGIDTRVFGRYILEDVVDREKNKVIIKKGEIISREISKEIAANENINSVRVRSVLACKCDRGVCSKCYGYDLGRNTVVKTGTPVGIIAAQSIGEPATQLVLRTFHSGGISGSDITQGLPRVEEIFEARSVKKKAFLAEYDGKIVISESEGKEKDKVITLSYKDKESEDYEIVKGMDVVVKDGDKVKPGETLAKAYEKKINAKNKGIVRIANDKISVIYEKEDKKEYVIPFGYTVLVKTNTVISKGDSLTDGSIDLYELYELKGQKAVELYVLKEIQHVYTSQGQDLNDKHIEIIVRQMFSKMRILNPGESKFIRGDITSLGKFNLINENLKKDGKKAARGILLLMGITKVSEFSDSWLSAASFQETTKALVNASISGEIDELVGLKENVIIGKLIPVGTGLDKDLLKNIRHESAQEDAAEIPNIEISMEEQLMP